MHGSRKGREEIQNKLDGDVPPEVPHWIVEFHSELDDRRLTPLEAVKQAIKEVRCGHCWTVTHVRSGLMWSVDLERLETVELVVKREGEGQ